MIRKAKPQDGPGKHEAHMLSIRELCARDHSVDEIAGWGHRGFDPEAWLQLLANKNCQTWVLELNERIEGYSSMEVRLYEGIPTAFFHGLYLTPTGAGKGWGRKMVEVMIQASRDANAGSIQLHSTITGRDFYRRMGFQELGPQVTIPVGGVSVRCFPMKMDL